MQAIILAAGFGNRLRPLTDTLPKSLTEINGVPLLVNALNILATKGVTETIIVLGHMREKIVETIGFNHNGMKITYVENSIFRETNNVYSLYLAKNHVTDDVLLLECDLFYKEELIDTIINGEADCNILVSRFNSKTMDGSVIEVDKNNNALNLVLGKWQTESYDYSNARKTVNIYKFKKTFVNEKFFPAIELFIKTQGVNSYYELVLGSLIYYRNSQIKVVEIDESKWAEVDNVEDLMIAEEKFK